MAGSAWLRGARIPNAHQSVTPSDTENSSTELPASTISLFVGGAGNITAQMWGESTTEVAYVGLAAGSELVGNFRYVKSTGTTATNIVARYCI